MLLTRIFLTQQSPYCPEDSYKKLYAEMYKKAYDEAYWDSFDRSYKAGFNAKFSDHYMRAYMRDAKHDALMKLDLDKIPFPKNEDSTQASTQVIQLYNRMQDLEKN
ncbi:hypothetical protein BCON_0094g00120 [Botryotinia convoluta]|uniref:Uncharacterized protein n=1 Tax=Botryotinia convoluta TaxID=54673 RepID=A0A4Z1IEQ7_9HELO|nr:hypothetical protein BCON_0094g00120 [Botryotinia convoluta]